ncbi:hypothetical protein ANCCAN_07280 [Ancylostoma caninum]|uniref:Uncharacterized protein n=1 Tax=Ancylostoma caninum TaxID=29170 RepID=A0A368GQJ7_ANCCA|nr:hypothetical protein ANCCAN_07280 [Ancylostoma caninum]
MMASYFLKSSHYCVDEEEKAKRCEQPNQRQQNVGNISKTIEIFPKLSVSSLPNSNSLTPSEIQDGIFNYITYNAVLRAHNPDIIRANSKTTNERAIHQMLQSVSNLPYVEEIDDNFTYEDLSVMRHPAEPHQSLVQKEKEYNDTFQ